MKPSPKRSRNRRHYAKQQHCKLNTMQIAPFSRTNNGSRVVAQEKERRRQRDARLKEMKQGSKRQLKEQAQKLLESAAKSEEEEQAKEQVKEGENEGSSTTEVEEENNKRRLLPADLLAKAAEEEKEEVSKKRKNQHLTAKDFERMAAEEAAAEEAERKKKRLRKAAAQERQVGEYTVKVLNHRPRPQPVDKSILNFRDEHMSRVSRKHAVLSYSQAKQKPASSFRRQQQK